MKKFYLWIALFTAMMQVNAQITLGGGSIIGSINLPINKSGVYKLTYSQQIYTANEINAPAGGNITGLKFYGTDDLALGSNTNKWKVSLGHTTKTGFPSNPSASDLITGLTQVFDGTVSASSGVVSITFSAPFAYNGTDNLVVNVDEYTDDNKPNNDITGSFFEYSGNGVYPSMLSATSTLGSNPVSYLRQDWKNTITFEGISVSCGQPQAIYTDNVAGTTATLGWYEPADGRPTGGYDYYLSTSPVSLTNDTVPTGHVSDETVTFTVAQSQIYYFYLRSICSDSNKSTWTPFYKFSSSCGIVSAFTEGFESYANGNIPQCWDILRVGGTLGSNQVSSLAASARTGSRGYLFGAGNGGGYAPQNIVILPQVSNINTATHQLKFYWRNSSSQTAAGTLDVGYIDDITDGSTFTVIKTIAIPAGAGSGYGAPVITQFSDASVSSSARIALRISTAGVVKSIYMDDFSWEEITCSIPSGLAGSSIETTTATVTWTVSSAPANGFAYYLSTQGTPPADNTTPTGTVTSGNSVDLINLTANTTYYIWVKSLCSAEASSWSDMYSFTTKEDMAVESVDATKSVLVYPNPVGNILNIDAKTKVIRVEIYNVAGNKVLDTTAYDKNNTVNLSKLTKGNYMVIIKLEGGNVITKKIIKN